MVVYFSWRKDSSTQKQRGNQGLEMAVVIFMASDLGIVAASLLKIYRVNT